MIIADALAFEMPFGKHKGSTLRHIAETECLYLDWLLGIDLHGELHEAVRLVADEYADEIDVKLMERT